MPTPRSFHKRIVLHAELIKLAGSMLTFHTLQVSRELQAALR